MSVWLCFTPLKESGYPIQYGTEAADSTSEEMLGFNSWQR